MRFEKGQSGNPGGRPKGHGDLRELARQHTEDARYADRDLPEWRERGRAHRRGECAARQGLGQTRCPCRPLGIGSADQDRA